MQPLRTYLHRFVPTLTAADWEALAGAVRPLPLARGEHFVQAGEERTTYFFFENHLLADYPGYLTGQPSQLSIHALTDAEPVVYYAVLRRLYDERPVYERFGRRLAEYRWAPAPA